MAETNCAKWRQAAGQIMPTVVYHHTSTLRRKRRVFRLRVGSKPHERGEVRQPNISARMLYLKSAADILSAPVRIMDFQFAIEGVRVKWRHAEHCHPPGHHRKLRESLDDMVERAVHVIIDQHFRLGSP
jgi:hypothetical protein